MLFASVTFSQFQHRQEGADGIHDADIVHAELLLAVVLRLPLQLSTDAIGGRVNQGPQT